jgi:hypothetical protein
VIAGPRSGVTVTRPVTSVSAAGRPVSTLTATVAVPPAAMPTWRGVTWAAPLVFRVTFSRRVPVLDSVMVLVPPIVGRERSASPNESVAGVAVSTALAAAATSSRPEPCAVGSVPLSGFAVPTSVDFTAPGDCPGCSWRSRAAAPATCGAAIEVPDIRYSPGAYRPFGTVERISTPGATRSGFSSNRCEGPREENDAI